MPPITYFCSLREADSQVVFLASRWGQKAAIISHDSDLFIYGGANDILVSIGDMKYWWWCANQEQRIKRITRIDWDDEKLTSRVTTKSKILNAFGLQKEDESSTELVRELQ